MADKVLFQVGNVTYTGRSPGVCSRFLEFQTVIQRHFAANPAGGKPETRRIPLGDRIVTVQYAVQNQGSGIKVLINKIEKIPEEAKKASAPPPPPAPPPPEEPPAMSSYKVPQEPIELIAVSANFRGELDGLLADIRPHEGGKSGIDAGAFAKFVDQFMSQYRGQISVTDHGSHFHVQTKTTPPISFGLWIPHFDGQVHLNDGGVGDALEIMGKICFVPPAFPRSESAKVAFGDNPPRRLPPAFPRSESARVAFGDNPPRRPPPAFSRPKSTDPITRPAGGGLGVPVRDLGMPKLPGWLHTLDQYRHIGPTGFVVDAGNFGQFRIHHVPEDDNCLFTAIGHFVGLDQGAVRQAIHIIAQGILNETILNPDPGVFTPEGIEAIMAMTNPETPAPLNRFNNGMEARMAAGMAAMILGRRVFIVNHFHGGDTPANEGFEANGNPITVEQIAGGQVSPINPGQDIVLYFIINPDPNPGPEERHVEALVPEAFVPEAFVPPPVMWRFFDGPPPEFGDRGLELPGWLHGLDDEHLLGPTGVAVQTPFGQFRIHHVPEDGNCLFAAIGHFVLPQLDLNPRAAQELVRRRIHDTAQGILNRRIPNPDPQQDLNPRGIRAVIHTTDPNALAQNRFGNIADARVAAIAFRRRVFIVNHFHAEGNPVFAGHHPALQGFDANGNPIDMEHLDRPINPGQGPNYDIVLYFIINLDPNRGPGELHMEALVR